MQTFASTINSANDDESNAYDCHRATCLANVLLQLDTRLPRLGPVCLRVKKHSRVHPPNAQLNIDIE